MPLPAVSVVLPFRDAESTVEEAVGSILEQTFRDFELIAIDDGSSDRSAAVIEALAATDHRIRLIGTARSGLVGALNAGLAEARADLVARMDADDVMLPSRLEEQVDRMRRFPELAVLGCRVELFPDDAIRAGYREYVRWQNDCVTHEQIGAHRYLESPFAHPTVMFRRELVASAGGYREGPFPEDYELWLRLLAAGTRMEKLPRVLLRWRESTGRASRIDPRYSREAFDRLRADWLARDPRLDSGRPLAIWGAGRRTRLRAAHLVPLGRSPAAWIDIDPKKIGRSIDGVPVVAPEWLGRDPKPFVLVYVATHGARELVAERLTGLGYAIGLDWLPVG